MRRRTLLSAVGATLSSALLAGCTGDGAPGSDTPQNTTTTGGGTTTTPGGTTNTATERPPDAGPGWTTNPTIRDTTTSGPDTTTSSDDDFRFDPATEEPFERIEVGSRENVLVPDDNLPHSVSVWNAADTERDIGVHLAADREMVRDRTVTVPADEFLTLRLLEPADYELALSLDGEQVGSLSVGTGYFDCNNSTTSVGVFPDGRIEHSTLTTLVACGEPNVADHAFTVTGATCGSGDEGSLSVEEETVTLDGAIGAPNPCHGATLSVGEVERAEGGEVESLTLVVTTTEPEAEFCEQCLGEVSYEGTVTFEGAVPPTVRLVHGTGEDATEVAAVGS
jgi:hypothetical protein